MKQCFYCLVWRDMHSYARLSNKAIQPFGKLQFIRLGRDMDSTAIPLTDVTLFKQKALHWANRFNVVCLLDGNGYTANKYTHTDWVLAVDALEDVTATAGNAFDALKQFSRGKRSNIYGFLSYELKQETEHLQSHNEDNIGFPHLYFFAPRYELAIEGNKVRINRNYPEAFTMVEQIMNEQIMPSSATPVELKDRTTKAQYLERVSNIKRKIVEGDFYEMNYCIEEYDDNARIQAVDVFHKLNDIAKAPFSSFFKYGQRYLMCASPERFLKKEGIKLISQPIKGTIKKGATQEENTLLQEQLLENEKERAENVMIVDLVRNDLARSCQAGTVIVEELFGVYAFETVNQMISTVTGELREEVHFTEAIKNAFPMGSMTGAPKVEVMKTIDALEDFQRGLYSGSVGYITPQGDFDFNVVIRSIFYNAATNYLSLRAGSAITFDANEESEWNEVMLKLEALKKSLL